MTFGNERCKEVVENICPHCGELLLMNKRSFANHVRWCKSNPKYNEIRKRTIERISKSLTKEENEVKEFTFNCVVCNKEYTIKTSESAINKGKYRKTCSITCARKLTHLNTDKLTKNNKISKAIKALKATTKSIKIEHTKICEFCGKEFKTFKNTQKCCSKSCAAKNKYKANKTIKNEYKRSCSFTFALNSFPDEFDFNLVEQFGWYKAKNHGNNLYGVSRDHIFSRDDGLKYLIDPYIISHPANCRLLQHDKNASKHNKSDITIDDLILKIHQWHAKYGLYENKIDYTYFDATNIELKYRKIFENNSKEHD